MLVQAKLPIFIAHRFSATKQGNNIKELIKELDKLNLAVEVVDDKVIIVDDCTVGIGDYVVVDNQHQVTVVTPEIFERDFEAVLDANDVMSRLTKLETAK